MRRIHSFEVVAAAFLSLTPCLTTGCGGADEDPPADAADEPGALSGTVTADGLTLIGDTDTAFEGVRVELPAGAATAGARLTIRPATDLNPLPSGAVAVGPTFALALDEGTLDQPVQVVLPFSPEAVAAAGRELVAVKVWRVGPEGWLLAEPLDVATGRVTLSLDTLTVVGAGLAGDEP